MENVGKASCTNRSQKLRGRNIGRTFTPGEEEAQSGTSGRISYFCSHLGSALLSEGPLIRRSVHPKISLI